jgi:hypothetical protein
MRQFLLTTLALACASLAFGQLETDTITIQASRSVSLTPDQVSFYVSVTADPTSSLDQIVAALSGSGITASNLSSMYGANDNRGSLQWSFTLAAPLTKITATIASLIALQQSIVKNNSGMSLRFQFQGAYVSPGISVAILLHERSRHRRAGAGPGGYVDRGARGRADHRDLRRKFKRGASADLCIEVRGFCGCELDSLHRTLVQYGSSRLLHRSQIQAAPLSVTASQSDKLTFP